MELLAQQVEYLKENGFNEQQANTLVHFHKDSIERSVATKRDIVDVRKEIADVYKAVEQLRADTQKSLEQLRSDTQKSLEQLRADTKKDLEQLRADTKKDLELLKRDMTLRLGSIMVAGLVALSAIMKLL